MQTNCSHSELVERLTKLLCPLSERGHGPDHDRLRELYLDRLEQCVGDPLAHALSALLQELLPRYIQPTKESADDISEMAIQAVHRAIVALATVGCQLEEHQYETAADALQTATQAIQESHNYLDALRSEERPVSVLAEAMSQAVASP